MPREITSLPSLLELVNSPKVTVVDFHATWCGPCKAVAPAYDEMSRRYDEATCVFCKVDVDKCPDIAARYNVQAMPTFAVFRAGGLVESIRGANMQRLEAVVAPQVRLVPPAFGGRQLGGSSGGGGVAAAASARRAEHPVASLFFKLRHAEDTTATTAAAAALLAEVRKTKPLGLALIPLLFLPAALPGKGPDAPAVLNTFLRHLEASSAASERMDAIAIVSHLAAYFIDATKQLTWEASQGMMFHNAVWTLAKAPAAAQLLTQCLWFGGQHAPTAQALEQSTLLGRLFAVGLDMQGASGHRAEQIAMMTAFPSDPYQPGQLDEAKQTAMTKSIQSGLLYNVNMCGNILKRLLGKPGPRDGTLDFLQRWLALSGDWKKFNHSDSKLSSESGMATCAMALVNAALPLVSSATFGAADSIMWEFFVVPGCFTPIYGKDVERVKAVDADNPLPAIAPSVVIKPETRIILYAMRALGLSVVPLLENLQYLRRAQHHHRRDPQQMQYLRARKAWAKALVGGTELATNTIRCVNGAAKWLLQSLGAASDGTLPAVPSAQWLAMPQELVSDVVACTMLVTAVGVPVPPEEFYYIVSLMLVLMGNTTYFPKAHTHALFPPFVMAMLSIPAFKEALMRHPWFQLHIVRGSVNCYCVMEQCFAEKLETRYQLSHCLLECLPLDSFCRPVQEEFESGQILERFSNFVTSEVNVAVDQCIESLTKMHALAEEGKAHDAPPPEDQPLPEGEEPAPTFDQRGQTLRSNILLFDTTVRLFLQLARRFPQGVAKNMVAQQLAQVLTRSLVKFSGRNSKELKIPDGEKYEFRPKELLLRLVECLTHFKRDESFLEAILSSSSSLDELFYSMDNIVSRGLVPQLFCNAVAEMKLNLQRKRSQVKEDDKLWEDAPDWAVCPLTGDPLVDPAALPPRVADLDDMIVVNRRSIHHALLTDEINPYTKQPMTKATLQAFNDEADIKAAVERRAERIKAWVVEAKQQLSE